MSLGEGVCCEVRARPVLARPQHPAAPIVKMSRQPCEGALHVYSALDFDGLMYIGQGQLLCWLETGPAFVVVHGVGTSFMYSC